MRVRISMGMLRRGGDARDVRMESIVGVGIEMRIGGGAAGAFLAGSSGCQFSDFLDILGGESNAHLIRSFSYQIKQQADRQASRDPVLSEIDDD